MSAILSALGKEAIKFGKKELSSRALKKATAMTTSSLKNNNTLLEAKEIVDNKDDSFFTKKNLVKAAATIGLGVATGGSSLLVQFIAMNVMDMGVDHLFEKFDKKTNETAIKNLNISKEQLEVFNNLKIEPSKDIVESKNKNKLINS